MKLDISINLNDDCEIIVSDTTQYPTDLSNIVFIEFLCYQSYDDDEDTILPIERSKVINKTLNRSYRYKTGYDGYYKYSKYGIYSLEGLLQDGLYLIKDKIFIYNDKIYLGIANIADINTVTSNATLFTNWNDLRKYIGDKINYFSNIDLFTICKLEHCLFELEKKTLFDKLSKCSKLDCEDYTKVHDIRDFLFVSVFVLHWLIRHFKYLEAQRILESLATCGELCGSNNFISNKNCNC